MARPTSTQVVVDTGGPSRRITIPRDLDIEPGDLVRTRDDGALERVFRPRRSPWHPAAETTWLRGGRLLERLAVRADVLTALRAHFRTQDSLEVETPSVATSPGLDLHLHAWSVTAPPSPSQRKGADESGRRPSVDASGERAIGYLITSPEYHMKRLLVGGVRRCHQFARCFRANEMGSRHEPEFTMLEWYRAWDDRRAMMDDTLAVVRIAARVGGGTPDGVRIAGETVPLDRGYETLTVREAFERWAPDLGDPIDLAERDEERYFQALTDRIEPRLGVERPTFLTQFPARHASLSRLDPADPTVCDRFELYVRGIELSNGFVELTDPDEQRKRLDRDQHDRAHRGLPVYPIDARFLAALEEGMPPSVGNALGFDRLLALVTGAQSISEVIAFPDARR